MKDFRLPVALWSLFTMMRATIGSDLSRSSRWGSTPCPHAIAKSAGPLSPLQLDTLGESFFFVAALFRICCCMFLFFPGGDVFAL